MTDSDDFKRKRPGTFITEDLTPLRQLISYKLRHDVRIAKCWSTDGKIKCLKAGHTADDKPITIDSPHDLTQAGWTDDEVRQFIQHNLLNKQD